MYICKYCLSLLIHSSQLPETLINCFIESLLTSNLHTRPHPYCPKNLHGFSLCKGFSSKSFSWHMNVSAPLLPPLLPSWPFPSACSLLQPLHCSRPPEPNTKPGMTSPILAPQSSYRKCITFISTLSLWPWHDCSAPVSSLLFHTVVYCTCAFLSRVLGVPLLAVRTENGPVTQIDS